eukprot:803979-Prorocentrum_minimum.AAC.1
MGALISIVPPSVTCSWCDRRAKAGDLQSRTTGIVMGIIGLCPKCICVVRCVNTGAKHEHARAREKTGAESDSSVVKRLTD